jgi:DNA (cytosine-5)-methyltransferase 1
MTRNNQASQTQTPEYQATFIDVFAGCGGLSLGLMQAGWHGLFAIEKSPMAFKTLRYNLIDQEDQWRFDWPEWLPIEAIDIHTLLHAYQGELKQLKGQLTLLAGGPPCQGFSSAGRRNPDDERNRLFDQYLKLVELTEPKILLIENVSGFATNFDKTERGPNGKEIHGEQFNADKELQQELIDMDYSPFAQHAVMARDFGVPQLRPRYILIAFHKTILDPSYTVDPFHVLYQLRKEFLSGYDLPTDREVTLGEAISDLLMAHSHVACIEPRMRRFRQGLYGPIECQYQRLMRKRRNGDTIGKGEVADSHRFPNHKQSTIDRFRQILADFRPGIQLREDELRQLNLNKHRIAPLAADEACHTLTSLPDDLVHYCEPRVPTVREYARIQSFPDWYEFKSAYTTGGKRRRVQVPRYTQAANAVPPLLAAAIGKALLQIYTGLPDLARPVGSPVQLEFALEETSPEEIGT